MLKIITIVVSSIVILGLMVWLIIKFRTRKMLLPSGKRLPLKEDLWQMDVPYLVNEYSQIDLLWLLAYVKRKVREDYHGEFSMWSALNRNLYIAIYDRRHQSDKTPAT